MAEFTKVASAADIPAGGAKAVEAGGKTLALFNCGGTFYAIENTCQHQGGPLAEGELSGTTVACPWHGWEYDVTTGACQMDEAIKVASFPVKVVGGDVLVAV